MIGQTLMDAYDEYMEEQVRGGVIGHDLDVKTLEGKNVEQAIVEILREADRLPEGYV